MDKYEKLWEIKYKEILQRLKGKGGAGLDPTRLAIDDLRLKVADAEEEEGNADQAL